MSIEPQLMYLQPKLKKKTLSNIPRMKMKMGGAIARARAL